MLNTPLYAMLFGTYTMCGLWVALSLRKLDAYPLIFGSVAYIICSSLISTMMIIDSRTLNSHAIELIGQSLLVFFSIVGGILFSSAWNELRAESRSNAHNNG